MSASKIVARLVEAGLEFPDGPPTRAHYCCRGQEPRTWIVYESAGPGKQLVEQVPWRLGWQTDAPSSGHEVLLDLPAHHLARAACLVGYAMPRDPWTLCVTDLLGFARSYGALLGPRARLWHWCGARPERVGREVLIRATRYPGICVGDGEGCALVQVRDQAFEPRWFEDSELEWRGPLVDD